MALTDADRLHMVSMALMRHSVIKTSSGGSTDSIKTINFFSVVEAPDISKFTLTED